MQRIKFPKSISSNYEGYSFLSQLASDTILFVNQFVVLDFSKMTFLDGNLCAVLGSIIDGMQQRRNVIRFHELNVRIQGSMQKNSFYPLIIGGEDLAETSGTTIPYNKFDVDDESGIKTYVENELLNRSEMPCISAALKREIIIQVFEIYANALTHGQSQFVFSCGQLYPRRSIPIINFTFVDLGKTIKNNVVEFLGKTLSGSAAIVWATSDNNSTKTDNHSGGIGLKIIKEFILYNGGKFQIVSGDGFWEFSQSGVVTDELLHSFPGTIVNLTFNVNDDKKYYLASEIEPTANIF